MEAISKEVELKSITIKFTPGDIDVLRWMASQEFERVPDYRRHVLQQFLAITNDGGR